MKSDWLIIGSGLSAFAAAMEIKKRGQSVVIVSKGPGATALSSGAWGFGPAQLNLSFENHWESQVIRSALSIAQAKAISQISTENVIKIVDNLIENLGPELSVVARWNKPFCLPTSSGSWRTEFVAQSVQCGADADQLAGKTIGLVGSPRWRFGFREIAHQLNIKAPDSRIKIVPVEIELPESGIDFPLSRVSAWLNQSSGSVDRFSESLNRVASRESLDGFLLPPILFESTRHTLEPLVKIPVAECLATVEPTAGYRLYQGMKMALKDLPYVQADDIRPEIVENRIASLSINSGREVQSLRPNSICLASGKLLGGGVTLGYSVVRESIFGLPLFKDDSNSVINARSQLDWSARAFSDAQDWCRVGLRVNERWIPCDETGAAVFENVRACGTLIGGIDWAHAGMGLGFSAISGALCVNHE